MERKMMTDSQLPPPPPRWTKPRPGSRGRRHPPATPPRKSTQHRDPHTWKMWYFMSLISMVLLLLPSCSDLLVISVLNLERRGETRPVLNVAFTSSLGTDGTTRHLTSRRGMEHFTHDCHLPVILSE